MHNIPIFGKCKWAVQVQIGRNEYSVITINEQSVCVSNEGKDVLKKSTNKLSTSIFLFHNIFQP